jgi:hypothetical protein
MTALGVKEAELGKSQIFYVTVTIENGESVAALKHTCAVIH